MIDGLFAVLDSALNKSPIWAIAGAFGWGLLSILLSPCHLSAIPLVTGYILKNNSRDRSATIISIIFSGGILLSIAVAGLLTIAMGRIMGDIGLIGKILVAVFLIFVGIYLMDVFRLNWQLPVGKIKISGLWGAFIVGLVFGLGLGPCTFAFMAPVLSIVFAVAHSNILKAVYLVIAFSVGHCILIVFAGVLLNKVQAYLNWTNNNAVFKWSKKICGVLVIMAAIYVLL